MNTKTTFSYLLLAIVTAVLITHLAVDQPTGSTVVIEEKASFTTVSKTAISEKSALAHKNSNSTASNTEYYSHFDTVEISQYQAATVELTSRLLDQLGRKLYNQMAIELEKNNLILFDALTLPATEEVRLKNLLVLNDAYLQELAYYGKSTAIDDETNPYNSEIRELLDNQYDIYKIFTMAGEERLQIQRMNLYLGKEQQLDSDLQWTLMSGMYGMRKQASEFSELMTQIYASPEGLPEWQYGVYRKEANRLSSEYQQILERELTPQQRYKLKNSEFSFWPGVTDKKQLASR